MSYAPDTLARPAEWWARAVCAQEAYRGSDLWYVSRGDGGGRETAIALCRTCPVIAVCRATTAKEEAGKGLKHRFGIRAGMTPRQRWLAEQASSQDRPAEDAQQRKRDRAPVVCGTRGGYQKHLRDHTEICAPCRQANTDADRRLRNTGTTKTTSPERSAA
ncbi:WhiB family transcriptional regulator [Streptomyces sp. sk2.1]|uniref:WhiB family transcriptional regulator n=1 Tax=Streptomyces sp. sk2.1 TaxID=2478959 RepID=UPI001652DF95|nr:WhiB family transcriptional regulator [Streptomyces sp. sk2.1]